MKLFAGFLVMSMIAAVLAVAALAQLVIALLPYLAVALIVALVLRRRRRNATPPAAAVPLRTYPVRAVTPPRYTVGAPAAAPEGWVMVPVWVAPNRPDPKVIDAEMITDDG
jgi:membrane protein implicated in regulation of membrane protease activity